MSKRNIYLKLMILFFLNLFVVCGCSDESGSSGDDKGSKESKMENAKVEPDEEYKKRVKNVLKQTLPGKVKVRFNVEAVNKHFIPNPKGVGLERLNLSPEEQKVFQDMNLALIRRVKPQLEYKENGKIRVLSEAELRELIGKKVLSENAAKAFLGIERDMILTFPPKLNSERICDILKTLPCVEKCETITIQKGLAPIHPDDPEYTNGNQWGLHNSAEDFDIDAPEAWEVQKGDAAVIVAVIDHGVQIQHDDLYEKIWINVNELPVDFITLANSLSSDGWPNILTFIDLNALSANATTQNAMANLRSDYNLTDDNGNGYIDGEDLYNAFADGQDNDPLETSGEVDDIVGWNFSENSYGPLPMSDDYHGTAVAGLVGAMTNNTKAIAGVGWNTRIMAIHGDWSWPSIEYAIKKGANIITSSLDPLSNSAQLKALLSTLEDEGIIFSAALGNINRYIGGTVYARYPYTIAVSNFRSNKTRPQNDGSGYSVNTDVAGPGSGTWSLDISGTTWFGGTSGANPIIAGILSLMVAERGDLTPEQYRQVLRSSAEDIPSVAGDLGENTPGFDYYSGWGLANAKNALDVVHNNPWAAAKITEPYTTTYYGYKRKERFHATKETINVNVFAGVPGGGPVNVVLEHAPGSPPVLGSWVNVYSADRSFMNDEFLTTINRNNLSEKVNTIRLTVTTDGKTFVDYQRVDVMYAYMNIQDNTILTDDFSIEGIACHPQFSYYKLQYAAGHDADESDASLWTDIGSPVNTERDMVEGIYYGWYDNTLELFSSVPIDTLPEGPVSLRLAIFNNSDAIVASHTVPVTVDNVNFPYQSGFPQELIYYYRCGGAVAYDLTGDGNRELIISNQSSIHVYKYDGTELSGWPTHVGDLVIHNSPSVGDVTGDGLPEIVVRAIDYDSNKDTIYVFSRNGEAVSPWPLELSTRTWFFGMKVDHAPVLADLDADGDLEIVISGTKADDADETEESAVHIYQGDGNLWTKIGPTGTDKVVLPPAVGDLDNDGLLDIVVITDPSTSYTRLLSIWHVDGTQLTTEPVGIFPETLASSMYFRRMVLVDLDADGDLEIVTCFLEWLRAFHHDGTLVAGWENLYFPDDRIQSIAAGDLTPDDGSDSPQIIVSFNRWYPDETVYRYGLYAFGGNGAILPGWDGLIVDTDKTFQQPSVFDVDNDGKMEVLIGPYDLDENKPSGYVHAFNHDATPVADLRFPISLAGELVRAPIIADLDRDGNLEYGVATHGRYGPVEVYDLDSIDDAGAVAWGMESHNPHRTNNYHSGIRIIEPTTTRPTDVGSFSTTSNKRSLLIRLKQEIPHGEINQSALTVYIGGVPASISALAQVEGEHWILAVPPGQPNAGAYLLEIVWNDGGIKRVDRQRDSVVYSDDTSPADQVLVVDRSGSMGWDDKYLSARTAGRFYVSARGNNDTVGVVSFNTSATEELAPPLELGGNGSTNRSLVYDAIHNVTLPGGATSIGAGLKSALENVLSDESAGRRRALVLVSDGLENTEPFWDMGANPVRNLFEQAENDDVVVHTIAIGQDADRDLHKAIADSTGGISRFVYLGNSLSIFGRLADSYKQVEEEISHFKRIFTKGEDIEVQESREYNVDVPTNALRAQFAISYRDPEAAVQIKLRDVNGVDVTNTATAVSSNSSRVLTLSSITPGLYQMEVTPLKAKTEVLVTASVLSPTVFVASLAWMHPEGEKDMAGTILAGLAENDPLNQSFFRSDVRITAYVVAPDKSFREIELFDDGVHRDGLPRDGIYGVPVIFDVGGGYAITLSASWTQNGNTQTLERTLGYFQARATDRDLDGVLDSWEQKHFPEVSYTLVNPLSDHDGDGLNTVEEFRYRTDPHLYDSDGDGRPDGYEVDNNTNPLQADPPYITDEDSDGDGIPDEWEKQHFPSTKPAEVDAKADPDGDGLSTFTEWSIGTDPRRSDSNGNGINDGVEADWRVPQPSKRGWSPQPSEIEPTYLIDWWKILFLLFLIVIVVFLIKRKLQ